MLLSRDPPVKTDTDTTTRGRCKQRALGSEDRNQSLWSLWTHNHWQKTQPLTTTMIRHWPVYFFLLTHRLFLGILFQVEQKAPEAEKATIKSKASHSSSSLLAVLSLIWPAGERAFKSESCLSTLVTGVDHSTGTLSMNIHQFHNMPAPDIFSLAHVNIKSQKHPQPGGDASHVCDSHLAASSEFIFSLSLFIWSLWLSLVCSGLCVVVRAVASLIAGIASLL